MPKESKNSRICMVEETGTNRIDVTYATVGFA